MSKQEPKSPGPITIAGIEIPIAEPFTALPMGLSLSAGDPLVSIRTSVPR